MIGNIIIKFADWYDRFMRRFGKSNVQGFLDWQDALNEISVR